MAEVISVRFKEVGKNYYFDPQGKTYNKGDSVIVETARGLEYGRVTIPNRSIDDEEITSPLKPVIRLANEKDIEIITENKEKEKSAFDICNKKIEAHGLDMKLVDVEITFDHNKLIFYFTSDGRVDFRELVKELAAVFRTRIELRQIGVRDEAKMLNGIGICGRSLCCATFLGDFHPVSIKMAKEQNLSLNSAKISGACGRLMCCLRYEYETYLQEAKITPAVDSTVKTPEGVGTVVEANALRGLLKVSINDSVKTFKRDDVKVIAPPKQKKPVADVKNDDSQGDLD